MTGDWYPIMIIIIFLNQEYGKENWRLEETCGNQQPLDEEVWGVASRVGEGAEGRSGGPGGKGGPRRPAEETYCECIPRGPFWTQGHEQAILDKK